ncbi:AI-2E family transporter [Candidatus Kaiserbacteria bacterium]|nr:AI-2E family transporter [Candidatus Kaiserbacteria bacterium]
MAVNRLVEYVFFFGFLGVVAFLVWRIFEPFINAMALSAVVVVICYPIYEWILRQFNERYKGLSAFLSTLITVTLVGAPLTILGSFVFREATSIYRLLNSGSGISIQEAVFNIEMFVQRLVPEFSIDIASYLGQGAQFVTSNLAVIFTSTASSFLLFFISVITIFYFFRDGRKFMKYLVEISPLPDTDDTIILKRLSQSVRSVALGIVLVAIIQGTLTAIGLSIFGFERAILWGAIAAFGALIPAIGTSIVFVPSVLYLVITGSYGSAVGVALWAMLAVGFIDNLLGPYLMSRGNTLHPLFILLAVLGGITLFGPIGFVLGPVILSLFKVLLEIYATHISCERLGSES